MSLIITSTQCQNNYYHPRKGIWGTSFLYRLKTHYHSFDLNIQGFKGIYMYKLLLMTLPKEGLQ